MSAARPEPGDPWFFGYGSLVNLATHSYRDPVAATLCGWARAWVDLPARPFAILTAIPTPKARIDGIIARVPGADWQALDLREQMYARRDATLATTPRRSHVAVYEVPAETCARAGEAQPILLSYLDVVLQGYHRMFGAPGPEHFVATTSGWDRPVLNDRAAPAYPRHQPISGPERARTDAFLVALNAPILSPADWRRP